MRTAVASPLPEGRNRLFRLGLGAVLVAAAVVFTLVLSDPVLQDLAVLTCYWLLLAGSWNLLAGFTGQISFAHVGLAAVGAYLTVFLEFGPLDIGPGPAIPIAGVMTAVAGLGLGLVSLRVRGINLALITFAFAGAFVVWATGARGLTGGASGHTTDFLFLGIDRRPFLWIGIVLVVVYFVSQSLILDSRFGLEAMAVRDREEVAEGLAVRTMRVKLAMFTYTAFWAGVAGSFYAGFVGIVAPSIGALINMGLVVAMVVIGGIARRFGPIVGVLLLQVIQYKVRSYGSEYTTLIFAGLVLVVMLFARDGLLGLAESAARRLVPARVRWAEGAAPVSEPAPLLALLRRGRGRVAR